MDEDHLEQGGEVRAGVGGMSYWVIPLWIAVGVCIGMLMGTTDWFKEHSDE